MTDDERIERIYRICPYLRNMKDCNQCQPKEFDPNYGPFVRGCFSLATEVFNIATTGDEQGNKGSSEDKGNG